MEKDLEKFICTNKHRSGLVSLDAPLISNLDVCSNIAIIRQYHQNMPMPEATALAYNLLRRTGMESVSGKRNFALTTEERFCVMLLRAAMVRDAILILDRPFNILTNLRDGRFIMDTLRKIDDLITEVHIFDYSWAKSCYWGANGAEN